MVSAAGVRPDLSKIEAVSNFPVPQEFHQLRKFLRLANYYRRFVKSYSEIAELLHQLTRKTKGYLWTSECQDAFEELKRRLITPPILVYPDFALPFLLYTDQYIGEMAKSGT